MYWWIEGLDGSGKSTLARELVNKLSEKGRPVQLLSFPSKVSAVGRLIRSVFEGKEQVDEEAMLWLFIAEAKDMENRIKKALDEGNDVICDRHTMISARVYQEKVHGAATVDNVLWAARFRLPDRIFLLDVPAEVSLSRRKERNEERNALYEPEELKQILYLRALYNTMLLSGCVFRSKVTRIDGTMSVKDIVDAVLEA
jgi:dTMP kinase